MPIGLATSFHRAAAAPPDALIDGLLRAGAGAVLLDETLAPAYLAELLPRLLRRRAELPVWAVENVCPTSRRAGADLCGLDRDEAAAAVEAATATIRLAGDSEGGAVVLLRLGEVAALRGEWPAARRAFLRDELAGSPQAEALRQRRQQQVGRHLDAALRSLERLGRVAEACGVRLGLRNPGRLIGLPSPAELTRLLGELDGAPLAPALDLPAAHLGDAMGMWPLAGTLSSWRTAELVLAADACAAVSGLPPGRGELDVGAALATLGDGARVCFPPRSDSSVAELQEGVAALARIAAARPAPPRAP